MDEKATAPMVKSAWVWSGGNYADSDALARMTENLNPMEVAQAALDAGIPNEYYLGNIPSKWTMTGDNAAAYSRFLDSIGKLKAMDGNTMTVGNHPVRGQLSVPVVRSGKAVGNLAEQEAAMLTRIAEIDGLLTDSDTVRGWKDFDKSVDHTVFGQDAGGHLVHPNYNPDNYVNPLELEARAQAAGLVAEGKLGKGDVQSWVAENVASKRQALIAERGRLNAAEEALRTGPMRKFVKPVYDEMTNVDAGGDVLTRTRMQAAGVPLGKADGSAAAVGHGLAGAWGDWVHDHNPWGNWVLDRVPGAGWLAGKLGAGDKGSDLVRLGPRLLSFPVTSSLESVDGIRQGDRASAVNRALEGRTYGNSGATAKVLNDMRSNDGRLGTGDQGNNWWSTSWVPGVGNIALNSYFGAGMAKMFGLGGAKAVAGAAKAPVAKSVAGKIVSSPSVQSFALGSGLQLYDGFSTAAKNHGNAVSTEMVGGVLPKNTAMPEKKTSNGNGVSLSNAGAALAAKGSEANDAELVDANISLGTGKSYVPGSKGVSGVGKTLVEAAESQPAPQGGGSSLLSRWWGSVKENPWPWLAGAGALAGGGMLLAHYLSGKRRERERKKPVKAPSVRGYSVPDYRGVSPVQAPRIQGGWSGDDPFDFYTGDFYY